MKKALKLTSLLLASVLTLLVASGRLYARVDGGGSTAEVWCQGPSGYEICLDGGDLFPTTDSASDLGTSTLRWSTAYFDTLDLSANLTAVSGTLTGNLAVTGTVTSSTITVTAIGGGVNVSTSATSSASLCLAGSFQTLPTTGYSKGCFAYQLSDATPYVSTETVVDATSWKALY